MKRVVCFGELLLRLSPPGDERLFQSPTLRTWFGGSEANVAAGIAHLGGSSAYVTRLPENALGDAAFAALRAEGIDVASVQRGDGRMGIYFVEPGAEMRPMRVVYDRGGSAFATLDPAAFDWPLLLRGAEWLHLSGITPPLGEGPAQAETKPGLHAGAMAHAHAQDEAPGRHLREREGRLGHRHGVARVDRDDAVAQVQARGRGAVRGEDHERIAARAVGHPHAVVAEGFGAAREVDATGQVAPGVDEGGAPEIGHQSRIQDSASGIRGCRRGARSGMTFAARVALGASRRRPSTSTRR